MQATYSEQEKLKVVAATVAYLDDYEKWQASQAVRAVELTKEQAAEERRIRKNEGNLEWFRKNRELENYKRKYRGRATRAEKKLAEALAEIEKERAAIAVEREALIKIREALRGVA